MPTIDLQYEFPTGSALDPNGHNGNMYSDPPEEGVLSAANGSLELPEETGVVAADNYAAALDREHFMLSEYMFFDRYVWEEPVTIYDDTAGGTEDDGEAAPSMLGIRFRIPAYARVVRVDYSFFLSGSRAIKVTTEKVVGDDAHKWAESAELESYVAVYLNGTERPEMRITLPQSLFFAVNNGASTPENKANYNHVTSYEHLTAQQYSDGFILFNVAPGTYTLQFRVRLENPAGAFNLDIGRPLGLIRKTDAISLRGHQRSTFGCGSVTVVGKDLSNAPFTYP